MNTVTKTLIERNTKIDRRIWRIMRGVVTERRERALRKLRAAYCDNLELARIAEAQRYAR